MKTLPKKAEFVTIVKTALENAFNEANGKGRIAKVSISFYTESGDLIPSLFPGSSDPIPFLFIEREENGIINAGISRSYPGTSYTESFEIFTLKGNFSGKFDKNRKAAKFYDIEIEA
jgi:hypothetical protein